MINIAIQQVIYPRNEEILNYWKHGIAPISLRGIKEGAIILEPFLSGKAVKSDQQFEPAYIWTKGEFNNPRSKPKIILASNACNRDTNLNKNLEDGLLIYQLDKLPVAIGFTEIEHNLIRIYPISDLESELRN